MKKKLTITISILIGIIILSRIIIDSSSKPQVAGTEIVATPSPTLTHTPNPTPTPMSTVQPIPQTTDSGLSNNNSYTNVNGNSVHDPVYLNTVPQGATAQCNDGTYSFSQQRQGTCSHHGGVAQWL